MLRASIVVIGDEILDGFVRDSNSGWLAGRLQATGVAVDRIVVVPDEDTAIAEALGTELARSRPRVLFTSGGIGTTPDDRTMAAVANFLGVGLVGEPTLLTMVDGIVARLVARGHDVDAPHRAALAKLAHVPDGARALTGPDGGAPAVSIALDGGIEAPGGAVIVILPGVPEQFRTLIGHLERTLLRGRGEPVHVVELRHGYPESVLTPTLEALERQMPEVGIGSYPGAECVLRVKGPAPAVQRAVARLRQVIDGFADDPGMQRLAQAWQRGWRDPDMSGTQRAADATGTPGQ
jgi:molybdopterin-biosynthesis enzyme MoeA-like protein